jgi:hypothetical protein
MSTTTRRIMFGRLVAVPASGALLLGPLAAARALAAPGPLPNVPVAGSGTNAAGVQGTFAGTLNVSRFVAQGGQVFAVGTLSGTLTDALGNVLGTVTNVAAQPQVTALATCTILDLTLGPLHLDLLGLVIDLNQVHLVITAEQAPGNLLGNLLCAIANLLNSNAAATALAQLLNQLLRIFG